VQQGNDAIGKKSAVDRKNTIHTISAADAQEFKRKARLVEVEWAQDMDKRGYDGKKLLETARALIDKHGKTTPAPRKI
jgi:TRAP-type transport system periplasmic protein